MTERSQNQIDCKHDWSVMTGDQRNGPGVAECKKCKLWLTHSNRLQLEMNDEMRKSNRKNLIITAIVASAAVISALGSAGSAILALPQFSKQINNIQVKVDSIEASLQQLYQHYDREVITCDQVKSGAKATSDGTLLTLTLKHSAIPNSVNVWWGEMYLTPTDYSTAGNVLNIHFNPQGPGVIIASCELTPIVVTYVENLQ